MWDIRKSEMAARESDLEVIRATGRSGLKNDLHSDLVVIRKPIAT